MSRCPRHRKEPRHRKDGPADHGHAALSLVIPALMGGVMLLVAATSGHWSYFVHHLPKWPITATPNGFTLLTIAGIAGTAFVGWRQLLKIETPVYELHDYDDSDPDPLEAHEIELAAWPPRLGWLESLEMATAHRRGRPLPAPEPVNPWFGSRADKTPYAPTDDPEW